MPFSFPASLIIQAIYYILAVIMIFLAVFGVYVLLRHGEKRLLSLLVSLFFSFFFLSLLIQSYATLQSII